MRKLLCGLALLPFLASMAMAAQPMRLTDQQMDKVAAGGVGITPCLEIPCFEPPCLVPCEPVPCILIPCEVPCLLPCIHFFL